MLTRRREPVPGRLVGSLWVTSRGVGRPLVLLHGNSQTHHAFDRLTPHLARPGRMLVGVDSRGHGRSPRGTGPLSIASMADDVAEVLDRMDLSGAILLGFSDGGNIALDLVTRHPGRVAAVITCGANLSPEGLTPAALDRVRLPHRVARALADGADVVSTRVARCAWSRPHGVVTAAGRGTGVHALRRVEERLRLMSDDPCITTEALARVECPVLVLAGERDVIRREHTREIADAVPRGQAAILRGAGHMIPRDHPGELARRVDLFLAGLGLMGDDAA